MKFVPWIARRLVLMSVQLAVVSFVVFAILFVTPGSPEQILLGDRPANPETLQAIRDKHHLDDPFIVQYQHWVGDALTFDFGTSVRYDQSVSGVIEERLPITGMLAIYAMALVLITAVPLGLLAGAKHGQLADRVTTIVGIFGVSAPAFALGTLLLYVFGVQLGWLPVFGAGHGFSDRIEHLTLPAITLAVSVMALVYRQARASAISVFTQDYVAFARARGIRERDVWGRIALRNSSLPVVTAVSLVAAYFLTGAVVVEQTFAVPGLGSLLLQAVNGKDVPVVQSLAMLIALCVLVVNLIADITYAWIDPRVRKASS
jgi:peptide/nickel transport system permease protein